MNPKHLLCLAALTLYGQTSDQGAAPADRLAQLADSVRVLQQEVASLRAEVYRARIEASTARSAQIEQELRNISALRRRLEEQETAREVELLETDEYVAEAKPKGEHRDMIDSVRYELTVTRPVKLARERSNLDQGESELRERLGREERLRQHLEGQLRAAPATSKASQ